MLSWITKIGEPGLKKQSEIAASLHEIKKQEHDFETFYFNGMVSKFECVQRFRKLSQNPIISYYFRLLREF